MLGDSMRRRRPPKERPLKRGPRSWRLDRLTWVHWLVAAAVILVVSFGTGFLLATLVIFPKPDTAGAGVAVPELYGRDRAAAERLLGAAGLGVGSVTEMASEDVPVGEVLAQAPVPGQQLMPGATVSLAVSSGPPDIRVPALRGLGAATARELLARAGFDVQVQQVRDERLPAGTVARTEPEGGTVTALPASVVLLVSAGGAAGADSLDVEPGGQP